MVLLYLHLIISIWLLRRYNIVTKPPWNDMQKHLFDGDQGVTVCTYPNGKLGNGMRYDTLVSTGFTSPVVAGLALDRNMDDAIKVRGVTNSEGGYK
jgi:hypothetical protein